MKKILLFYFLSVFYGINAQSLSPDKNTGYIQLSGDFVKYKDDKMAKLTEDDGIYRLEGLENQFHFTFKESKGVLANGVDYFAYAITDEKTQEKGHYILYNPTELLGKRSTFVHNFKETPQEIFTRYGFLGGWISKTIQKTKDIAPETIINAKNDSINAIIKNSILKYEQDKIRVEFDGKIRKNTENGWELIGRVEKQKNPDGHLIYQFFKINKENNQLDLLGFYTTGGDFEIKLDGKKEKVRLIQELLLKNKSRYKIKYISEDNSLPITKSKNIKQIAAFINYLGEFN